ncbi:zinc-binding metallopeptidase family protein [Methylobrevis pamukkalensis]|uniref:Zinc-ribbon domain-containing protein n=1 Tax=Methylobrevis pamukkalensis TaxID=1439726 RepID=A0A1E3H6Y9_9HYPH|nr:putative zinc-binding metallopeptidase [Methylobrevis pamukkalensis]ODN72097.1 hypothetical protein A6302_00612 [Methylobrevis pamukkalensis]
MRNFECQVCQQTLDFANVRCNNCGHRLGFLPERAMLCTLVEDDDGNYTPVDAPEDHRQFCSNAQWDACNWMVPAGSAEPRCVCCSHNRMIPDLDVEANLANWRRIERAKHHLFYSLLRLGLPIEERQEDPPRGLAFDILSNEATDEHVMTGHENGLITLDVAEGDDAERERRRAMLREPYRTLLGHFRHEVAHYYWEVLVDAPGLHAPYREVFGDEREDYAEALQRHYANGAPLDWTTSYISAYAASHSWEDFAETFAHYLHIVDTLETARAFGINLRTRIGGEAPLRHGVAFDPYEPHDIDELVSAWVQLTFAVNCINRSMGQPDLYPFVLSEPVTRKLAFIRDLIDGRVGVSELQAAS